MNVKLTIKNHVDELTAPGDYCFVLNASRTGNLVVLACPFCGNLMSLFHRIVVREPLTVEPSVVGPHNSDQRENCAHHFMIERGEARGL